MKELTKKATKRYNDIMTCLGYEHNTINTRFSENTDNWNLRDMIAECDYILSTYYENGHGNNDLKYECYKQWLSDVNRLKRFINRFEVYINDIKCTIRHCSKYDN